MRVLQLRGRNLERRTALATVSLAAGLARVYHDFEGVASQRPLVAAGAVDLGVRDTVGFEQVSQPAVFVNNAPGRSLDFGGG